MHLDYNRCQDFISQLLFVYKLCIKLYCKCMVQIWYVYMLLCHFSLTLVFVSLLNCSELKEKITDFF